MISTYLVHGIEFLFVIITFLVGIAVRFVVCVGIQGIS